MPAPNVHVRSNTIDIICHSMHISFSLSTEPDRSRSLPPDHFHPVHPLGPTLLALWGLISSDCGNRFPLRGLSPKRRAHDLCNAVSLEVWFTPPRFRRFVPLIQSSCFCTLDNTRCCRCTCFQRLCGIPIRAGARPYALMVFHHVNLQR